MAVAAGLRPIVVAVLVGAATPVTAEVVPVDLELVLAVDISGSIDPINARLQRAGYVAALRHPEVALAIEGGEHGRIAVSYVEWAGETHQHTVLPWTLMESGEDAMAFSEALAEAPFWKGSWTSISAAIDYAAAMFAGNGYDGTRRVIDISGDGYNNRGRPLEAARDEAVAAGITINGLPILHDRPSPLGSLPPADLDRYFEERVIGGEGAFVIVAREEDDFARAILAKLYLEIAGEMPAARGVATVVR
jgi:hypothetical protein